MISQFIVNYVNPLLSKKHFKCCKPKLHKWCSIPFKNRSVLPKNTASLKKNVDFRCSLVISNIVSKYCFTWVWNNSAPVENNDDYSFFLSLECKIANYFTKFKTMLKLRCPTRFSNFSWLVRECENTLKDNTSGAQIHI